MTYGPRTGDPQQPQQPQRPHQQPYQGNPSPLVPHGSGWASPQPPGPRRSRQAALIIAVVAAVVVATVVITVVLTSGGDNATWSGVPGTSAAPTPTSATGPSTSGSAGSARPLPPPTPTGKRYEREDPKEGECADLSRKPNNSVSIYQADCADPAAMLILESVQPKEENCPGRGYFGLASLSNQKLCFTYNFTTGDCIDMAIPRRTTCDDTPGAAPDIPKLTILEVRLGQRDGTGCRNPTVFFQVGKDDQRGIACGGSRTDVASSAPSSSK